MTPLRCGLGQSTVESTHEVASDVRVRTPMGDVVFTPSEARRVAYLMLAIAAEILP